MYDPFIVSISGHVLALALKAQRACMMQVAIMDIDYI